MSRQTVYSRNFGGTAAENYQRFFVPAIGAPVADDLIAVAGLQPGERVLDVACGTGVVTRLAAERVTAAGSVTGLDINPGMLAIAEAATPSGMSIDWHEANVESMPFSASAFDVVHCQMGLQFVASKLTALREMRRVLKTGGRAAIVVPGAKPPLSAIMTDALARHLGPEAASFGDLVFSMHDVDELKELMRSAGFRNVDLEAKIEALPARGSGSGRRREFREGNGKRRCRPYSGAAGPPGRRGVCSRFRTFIAWTRRPFTACAVAARVGSPLVLPPAHVRYNVA